MLDPVQAGGAWNVDASVASSTSATASVITVADKLPSSEGAPVIKMPTLQTRCLQLFSTHRGLRWADVLNNCIAFLQ